MVDNRKMAKKWANVSMKKAWANPEIQKGEVQ